MESWLKSFLTVEQLGQVCRWVRNGVSIDEVRWVPLGGEPKAENAPPITVNLPAKILDLFIRVPEVRTTRVDLFEDVILRDLLVHRVESKLVNVNALKFYAEVKTFDTTYYSDRAVPAIDLVQDTGLVAGVSPNKEQMEELATYGMTRSEAGTREFVSADGKVKVAPFGLRPPGDVRADDGTYKLGYGAEENRETIRRGLTPIALDKFPMTCVRSQIIGALLEGEMAYVIIWNNPRKSDPVRYLTTVITTSPYGMARIWALRDGSPVCEARAAFDSTDAPIGMLVSWAIRVLDQRALFFDLDKPVAAFAFGRRPLAPWSDMPRQPLSNVKMMQELAGSEEAGK
jgi:hypothetical protein